MPNFTETLTVYRPTQAVSATDLSVLPAAVSLVGTITGNLHRGTASATAAAQSLGVFNVQPAELYTGPENAANVGDRYVIADQRGQYWVVHGVPSVRTRFAATGHVKAICTLMKVKVVGIP